MNSRVQLNVLFFLGLCYIVSSLYVPGVPLRDYKRGETVHLSANSIRSVKTQLPYEYFTLPVCARDHGQRFTIVYQTLNLGEVLQGYRIVSTPMNLTVLQNTEKEQVCTVQMTDDQRDLLHERITQEYLVHFILDNLPAVVYHPDQAVEYTEGIPLGFVDENGAAYVFNHYNFTVLYHQPEPGSVEDWANDARIVGFICEYSSVASEGGLQRADADHITWSYEVSWQWSPIPWRNRWDAILSLPPEVTDAHVKTFVISLILVALLIMMVVFTLFRTVRDIRRYNAAAQEREESDLAGAAEFDETGWKNCHDDVFRRPVRSGILSVFVGAGVHLCAVSFLTVLLSAFGILSPASRGSWLTAWSFIFAFTGVVSGFASSRIFRMFREMTPLKIAIATSMFWPSVFAFLGTILVFVMIPTGSTMALPFGTFAALTGLWILFIGGNLIGRYFARRARTYQYPVKVNDLPREIPAAPWYVRPIMIPLAAGILPFAVMFIALHYTEASLWFDTPYYLYGFSILSVILVLLTSASSSIIVTYFFLCWENYHWWWRAFFTPASSALYVFIYLIYFLGAHLRVGGPGAFLFLVHAVMVSLTLFLLLGSVGLLTTLLYVWRMYASVKID